MGLFSNLGVLNSLTHLFLLYVLVISISCAKTSKGIFIFIIRKKCQFLNVILTFCKTSKKLHIYSPNKYVTEINTGKPKVIDARGQSISRGVHSGIAFADFKAHKFSYLNITSLATDYVLNGKECGLACVNIPSCFSFNLAAFFDINGRISCELLPSDKYNNSDKFVPSQYFHHFSIRVRLL